MIMQGTEPLEVGRAFVRAVASKDRTALTSLFDAEVDFRGLTPSQAWRATSPEEVAEIVFGSWFEPSDHVQEVLELEVEPLAERHHLRYRFRVETDDVMYLVEQQGYYDARDGRITRMSVMCSGFRPWTTVPAAAGDRATPQPG
jgi:hypothetical protein